MIKVNREVVNPPEVLVDPNKQGCEEQKKAIEFYKEAKNAQKSFEYKIYKDESIKKIFNTLFHNKCGYCESNYAKVHPVDVEHYRPKGGVIIDGKLEKPGYYWLASDWNNLLPSCIDCNRRRTHETTDKGSQLLGKENLFPIANESLRARRPGFEVYEKRLLLDPCRDNPEEHLIFKEDGSVEGKSFMGMVSIETYGLMRKNLVEAREAKAKLILRDIARIKRLIERIDSMPAFGLPQDIMNEFQEELTFELKNLKSYLDNKQEYKSLAKSIIYPFLRYLSNS